MESGWTMSMLRSGLLPAQPRDAIRAGCSATTGSQWSGSPTPEWRSLSAGPSLGGPTTRAGRRRPGPASWRGDPGVHAGGQLRPGAHDESVPGASGRDVPLPGQGRARLRCRRAAPPPPRASRGIPEQITAMATYAGLKPSARAAILDQLEQAGPDHAVVASNVRCLSEGIDIPALDAIVFADPRRGLVDVVQAVGRVLRPHPGKTAGTVILPVLMPAETSGHVRDGHFGEMIHVLRVLREHDDELAAQLDEMRRDVGRGLAPWRTAASTEDGRLRLLLPHGMPDSFVRAFSLHVVRATSSSWRTTRCSDRLDLRPWAQPGPDGRGGRRHAARPLGARAALAPREGPPPSSRAARLEALSGWTWTPWEAAWERAFVLIQEFVHAQGHSRVPQTYWRDGVRARRLDQGSARAAAEEPAAGGTRPPPGGAAGLVLAHVSQHVVTGRPSRDAPCHRTDRRTSMTSRPTPQEGWTCSWMLTPAPTTRSR